MNLEPKILYSSNSFRVVYQPADSDILAFSFNGGEFGKTETEFFGSAFFRKRGIAAVGFVDLRSGWFPPGEMNRAIHAVNSEVRRRPTTRAVTYGISMGAWGALKYARRLRAQGTVAFGPQWSIDPGLVGHFDRRYVSLFQPAMHTGMQISEHELSDQTFLFFDPHAPEDREHARMLSQMKNVHCVVGPFLGHPTIQYFTEMRLIDGVITLGATPEAKATDFRWLVRSKRSQSSRYFLGRAEHLHWNTGGRWMNTALRSYREAVRLNRLPPEHRDAIKAEIALVGALLDVGQTDEAWTRIDALCALAENRVYSPELRELLLRVHASEKARELAYRALEKEPRNAELRIDLARIFMADHDTDRAKAEVDVARELAGRRPLLWQRIASIYSRLGFKDEARAAPADARVDSGETEHLRTRQHPDARDQAAAFHGKERSQRQGCAAIGNAPAQRRYGGRADAGDGGKAGIPDRVTARCSCRERAVPPHGRTCAATAATVTCRAGPGRNDV